MFQDDAGSKAGRGGGHVDMMSEMAKKIQARKAKAEAGESNMVR